MANLQHDALTSAQVHEPKHITLNGTGASGKVITNSSVTPNVSEYRYLTMNDLDNVEEVLLVLERDSSVLRTHYIAAPFSGTVISWVAVIDAALVTGANTYELQIDGATVTGTPITFPVGGAPGDQRSASASGANTFASGDNIMIVCTANGNTDATVDTRFTIIVRRS